MEKHNASIVISSCARILSDWKERILASFKKAGWDNPPIIDKTPSSRSGLRGLEIEMWISKNPLDQYIIIDDDASHILPEQIKRYVRTYGYEGGLQNKHLEEIDNILVLQQKTAY
ncbi:MAG: HAD domain-containing protein [Candidatus Paceibacterota bacterium]